MKTFYLDTYEFDSIQKAETAEDAVKQLFPDATKIKFIGWDNEGNVDFQIFDVEDDDVLYSVQVFDRG